MSEPAPGKPGIDWDHCPDDVLLMVFGYLDVSSITRCLFVNQWWRNVAEYFIQHKNVWHIVATEMIANKGTSFIQKSLLDWRDLYNNHELWQRVDEAHVKCDCELTFSDGVLYMHVYKDILTVVHKGAGYKSEMETFTINESGLQRVAPPFGPYKRMAFPAMPADLTNSPSYFYGLNAENKIEASCVSPNAMVSCDNLISKLYGPEETLDDFEIHKVGKDKHIICLYFKQGTMTYVYCLNGQVSESYNYNRPHTMMHSEKIFRPNVVPGQYMFAPRFEFDLEDQKGVVTNQDSDELNFGQFDPFDFGSTERNNYTFDLNLIKEIKPDCLAVYNSGKRFVGLSLGDMTARSERQIREIDNYMKQKLRLHLEHPDQEFQIPDLAGAKDSLDSAGANDSWEDDEYTTGIKTTPWIPRCVCWLGCDNNLTSATQHGDMLLLGYIDGKIEIHKINFEVIADTSPAKLEFNIKDHVAAKDGDDLKVIVIEVYEMKNSHCLIIATPFKVYRFVLTYPFSILKY